MLSTSKIKCPNCGRHIMKKIIAATEGRCNNCGYLIASSIMNFVAKPKSTLDMLNGLNV